MTVKRKTRSFAHRLALAAMVVSPMFAAVVERIKKSRDRRAHEKRYQDYARKQEEIYRHYSNGI